MSLGYPTPRKPPRMIVAAGGGIAWQTMLADLALILFMVTAAAMGQPPRAASPPPRPEAASGPRPAGEPVAVWRAGAGAMPLAAWLERQQADRRLLLTVTARYAPGGQAVALAQAGALAGEAGRMGREARIVIEAATDGEEQGAEVTLAYDRAGGQNPNGTQFARMGPETSPETSSAASNPASNAQALP